MRPIRLNKREKGTLVLSVLLSLASFVSADWLVFLPLLSLSLVSIAYLAYHHEGPHWKRLCTVLAAAAVFGTISYRMFMAKLHKPYPVQIASVVSETAGDFPPTDGKSHRILSACLPRDKPIYSFESELQKKQNGRPSLVAKPLRYVVRNTSKAKDYFDLFLEFSMTNVGEPSAAKDFVLCLVGCP